MSDKINKTNDAIMQLPSAPLFMQIMKTIEGRPTGMPIWNSFVHKNEKSLLNENMGATFLSLSKNFVNLSTQENDGSIFSVSANKKTYNFYLASALSDFQIAFVVVFEDKETILVKKQHRDELIKNIVSKLKSMDEFVTYIRDHDQQIEYNSPLYNKIRDLISDTIKTWDKKRVEYIEKADREKRKKILELAKEQEKERKRKLSELKKSLS